VFLVELSDDAMEWLPGRVKEMVPKFLCVQASLSNLSKQNRRLASIFKALLGSSTFKKRRLRYLKRYIKKYSWNVIPNTIPFIIWKHLCEETLSTTLTPIRNDQMTGL
jgi:hypothetical protein